MIQFIIGGLLILLAAFSVGFLIHQDPGYILISYSHWTLETSLWFGILVIFLVLFLYILLTRFLRYLFSLSARFHRWELSRSERKRRQLTDKGVLQLIEGHFAEAENHLVVKQANPPLVNYLAAAIAAQKEQAFERRDHYLNRSLQLNPSGNFAINLLRADLQLAAGQSLDSLETLTQLQKMAPHHPRVLALLNQAYQLLGDWRKLELLLPTLKKYSGLSEIELTKLKEKIYQNLLNQADQLPNTEELMTVWNRIPASDKVDPIIASNFIQSLLKKGEDGRAINEMESLLKKHWLPVLLPLYAEAKGGDVNKQLENAEKWATKYPKEPEVLLCCAQLCLRSGLSARGQQYLEKSLSIKSSSATYWELAKLAEAQGNKTAALDYYRKMLNQ